MADRVSTAVAALGMTLLAMAITVLVVVVLAARTPADRRPTLAELCERSGVEQVVIRSWGPDLGVADGSGAFLHVYAVDRIDVDVVDRHGVECHVAGRHGAGLAHVEVPVQ